MISGFTGTPSQYFLWFLFLFFFMHLCMSLFLIPHVPTLVEVCPWHITAQNYMVMDKYWQNRKRLTDIYLHKRTFVACPVDMQEGHLLEDWRPTLVPWHRESKHIWKIPMHRNKPMSMVDERRKKNIAGRMVTLTVCSSNLCWWLQSHRKTTFSRIHMPKIGH